VGLVLSEVFGGYRRQNWLELFSKVFNIFFWYQKSVHHKLVWLIKR